MVGLPYSRDELPIITSSPWTSQHRIAVLGTKAASEHPCLIFSCNLLTFLLMTAPSDRFKTDFEDCCEPLSEERKKIFCAVAASALHAGWRARPDVQLAMPCLRSPLVHLEDQSVVLIANVIL